MMRSLPLVSWWLVSLVVDQVAGMVAHRWLHAGVSRLVDLVLQRQLAMEVLCLQPLFQPVLHLLLGAHPRPVGKIWSIM